MFNLREYIEDKISYILHACRVTWLRWKSWGKVCLLPVAASKAKSHVAFQMVFTSEMVSPPYIHSYFYFAFFYIQTYIYIYIY